MTKNLGLESSKLDSSFEDDECYFASQILNPIFDQTRHTVSAECSKQHFHFYSNDVRVETQLIYCDTKKNPSQILQEIFQGIYDTDSINYWTIQYLFPCMQCLPALICG